MSTLCDRWLLPQKTADAAEGKVTTAANLALVFDKYAGKLKTKDNKIAFDTEAFQERIGKEAGAVAGCLAVEGRTLLECAHERLDGLVEALCGKRRTLRTASRLVTGIGLPSPMENGLALHPSYGVPYLPGSGIKGMVLGWLQTWSDEEVDGAVLARIFGTPAGAGSVIFVDALPDPSVRLELDVMTPHYQAWYQRTLPPADWLSPNPILFYVVPEGTPFTFRLAARTGKGPSDRKAADAERHASADVEKALAWLERALAEIGIGAKTKSGYGRF